MIPNGSTGPEEGSARPSSPFDAGARLPGLLPTGGADRSAAPGGWARAIPVFILGGALAVASVVAAGLLLYGGPGFLGALSVLLATLLGALSAGVAAGQRVGGVDPVDLLRRRWLLVLVSFTLAALFSGVWEGFRGFGATGLTQGIGLALLGALPLFAGGAVLGTIARVPELTAVVRVPRLDWRLGGSGPIALAGAAAGALALGFLLFPVLSPAASLLTCLVALSGGALVQGRALDEITWARDRIERADSAGGKVGVERWIRARPKRVSTAVLEAHRLRLLAGEDGRAVLPLDRALHEGFDRWIPRGGRSLVLGAGGALLARLLAVENGGGGEPGRVVLVDGNEGLLEAVDEILGAPLELRRLPVEEVLTGSLAHLPPAAFDHIHLETLALASSPGRFRFPDGSILRLHAALRPGGVLTAGPLQDGGRSGALLKEARRLSPHFERISLYVGGRSAADLPEYVPHVRVGAWNGTRPEVGARPAFLVAAKAGRSSAAARAVDPPPGSGAGPEERHPAWPDRVESYLRVMLDDAGPGR